MIDEYQFDSGVSVVIPAYNESEGISETIVSVSEAMREFEMAHEIVVVDDGSRDDCGDRARKAGARVIRHPVNLGYGNALMTGISASRYSIVAICDADGTYPVQLIPELVRDLCSRRLDMLVGARRGRYYQGSMLKRIARFFFRILAEFTCGHSIPDVNSGLRVMRRDMVMQFQRVLCGGFSFTTTITMIAFLTYRFVDFREVPYMARRGASHVRYLRDTLRTLQILAGTIVIFNPIKLYLLAALITSGLGLLATVIWYAVPALQPAIAILGLFGVTAEIMMGIGFLAEQRRTAPNGIVPFLREPQQRSDFLTQNASPTDSGTGNREFNSKES